MSQGHHLARISNLCIPLCVAL